MYKLIFWIKKKRILENPKRTKMGFLFGFLLCKTLVFKVYCGPDGSRTIIFIHN